MKAKIINKDCYHVSKVYVNDRPRFYVDKHRDTTVHELMVIGVINDIGSQDWTACYNELDRRCQGEMPTKCESWLERHCV
jgi:hypothetical protein